MPIRVAGVAGFGTPQALVIFLVVMLIIFLIGRAVGKSKQFTRFCPKCGRGLTLPKGPTCCPYCGVQLP
jgi:rRNA maturation endonuclease Nob1